MIFPDRIRRRGQASRGHRPGHRRASVAAPHGALVEGAVPLPPGEDPVVQRPHRSGDLPLLRLWRREATSSSSSCSTRSSPSPRRSRRWPVDSACPSPRTHGDKDRAAASVRRSSSCSTPRRAHFTQEPLECRSGTRPASTSSAGDSRRRPSRSVRAGAARDSWDDLLQSLRGSSASRPWWRRASLVTRPSGDGHYDRFRNRAVFPIFDEAGKVVAFGARSIDGSDPKYLNSPETAVYQKSRILYGLSWSEDALRKGAHAVLMEGYLDVARALEGGVVGAVATCGTALTPAHARLLRRQTPSCRRELRRGRSRDERPPARPSICSSPRGSASPWWSCLRGTTPTASSGPRGDRPTRSVWPMRPRPSSG